MKMTKKKPKVDRKPVERKPKQEPKPRAVKPTMETLPAVRQIRRTSSLSIDEFVGKWAGMKSVFSDLVKTGFLPKSVDTTEKAMALYLAGKEMAIPPMTSMRKIHIINGNPGMAAELMWALAHRSNKLEWKKVIENTKKLCTIELKRRDEPHSHIETFTFEEASEMKTKEDGKIIPLTEKFNWRTMPAVMLYSRCSSRILRRFMPDVINLYTPEELEDTLIEEPASSGFDVVNDKTGETTHYDAKPVEVAPGATGRIFDCTTEVVPFKKHEGLKWIELDNGFLNWLISNHKDRDVLMKAKATLDHKASIQAQAEAREGPSPLDATFSPEGQVAQKAAEGKAQPEVERLAAELRAIQKTGEMANLNKWLKENTPKVNKMPVLDQEQLHDVVVEVKDALAKKGGAK